MLRRATDAGAWENNRAFQRAAPRSLLRSVPLQIRKAACLCRDLTRNSAFHSRKSTNPLRSCSLVMQRRGWGQYRSGQGRSRGSRHYTVRLRGKVRSASAVACVSTCSCWGSSLSLGRPGCVSGRQTGWQTHSLARRSLLQTLSKNPLYLIIIQKIKDIPLPPIPHLIPSPSGCI